MQYFIAFLEGMITFISPCLLPMLPLYLTYFAGGGEREGKKTLLGALGFVLGFTAVFVAMGALAGTVGSFLLAHQRAVNIVSGLIVILFGVNFLFPLFHGRGVNAAPKAPGFLPAVALGIVFSIGWTPCVGAFLGAALVMAAQEAQALAGMLMLLCYSLGLGIPFVLSAVLIDQLKGAFDFIKRHYRVINMVSGGLLILLGILMATGYLSRLMAMFQ